MVAVSGASHAGKSSSASPYFAAERLGSKKEY
jgi:hypothetical protein